MFLLKPCGNSVNQFGNKVLVCIIQPNENVALSVILTLNKKGTTPSHRTIAPKFVKLKTRKDGVGMGALSGGKEGTQVYNLLLSMCPVSVFPRTRSQNDSSVFLPSSIIMELAGCRNRSQIHAIVKNSGYWQHLNILGLRREWMFAQDSSGFVTNLLIFPFCH